MSGVTKSIHPLYKESVVISIPNDEVAIEGITHYCKLARIHYENDYTKPPTQVEVITEDGVTHVVARSNIEA